MSRIYIKILAIVIGCSLLISCGDERRVDGELAFDSKSLMNMAETFLKAGDYSNAMRLYQRAANENPKNIPSRLGLAKTYQSLGATDAAINFYGQVLQLDPTNKDARMGTGEMLITKNRPAEAIRFLTALSKEDPKNHRIYNMLGLAHDLLGEQEEAQMNYGRGLTLAPDNISLLNNLALSLAFEKQYAPSIRLLSKAINLDYSVTKARHNLVLVYVLSGEEDAGRKIGKSFMTAEEMDNKIRHYKWVKTLTPGQRAQAIFLGIKHFPGEVKEELARLTKDKAAPSGKAVSNDPKKNRLMELLRQQEATVEARQPTEKTKENNIPAAVKTTVPETESKPVSSPFHKIYRVQLGSYPNTELARRGWQKIMRRGKAVLAPYEPLVKLVTLANGKNLFRLFVGNVEDRAIARTVCNDLRDKKIDCLVLKTSR